MRRAARSVRSLCRKTRAPVVALAVLLAVDGLAIADVAFAQQPARPPAAPAAPSPSPETLPAVISADEVVYDREGDIVTASGNVQIVQGGRVLRADTLAFDRRRGAVSASGNVTLVEPTGDAIFADHAELTDDLREGAIQNFRGLLADWSRLAGASARRSEGNATVLRKVVYSPCQACREDPSRPPVWQVKASRATHDQAAQTIHYRDAWLELGGVPVLYLPYLQHPDGTATRQTGLLAPAFGTSSVLGQFYAQPYYITLGKSADVTLEPILFSKENPVLAAEYRQRFAAGVISLNGSITNGTIYDDQNRSTGQETIRSHVAGTGRFDIDDDWRWGFDLARASHDGYLLRYKLFDRFRFIDRNTLTSRVYVEGFNDRSYATTQSFAFQGLRTEDDPSMAPLVLPVVDYNWIGKGDVRGGYFDFRSYSYGISRTQGTVSQRSAGIWGYTLPYVATTGEVWTLNASLQGDVFNISDRGSINDGFQPRGEGVEGRVLPQIALSWGLPLMLHGSTSRLVVEPIVSVAVAPDVHDVKRFPNEDSRAIDLDEASLFRRNRFSGLDRLEGGQRVTYGFKTDSRPVGDSSRLRTFLAQSYRLKEDGSIPAGSGLENKSSDILGRITLDPWDGLSTSWRFQADNNSLRAVRSIAAASVGSQALGFSFAYTFSEKSTQSILPFDLEQISAAVRARLDENWRFQIREARSIGDDAGPLRFNSTLIYEDECFLFGIDFERRRTGNPFNPPDTSLVLRISLRNLGEARLDAF